MNIKNIPAFILLIALYSALQARDIQYEAASSDTIMCISIPKCGTHLLLKCLELLGDQRFGYYCKPEQKLFKKITSPTPPHHTKGRFYFAQLNPVPKEMIDATLTSLEKNITQMHNQNKIILHDHLPYFREVEDYLNAKTRARFFIFRDPRAMIVSMAYMIKDGWEKDQHASPQDLTWDFINSKKKHFIPWGVANHGFYPLLWEIGVVNFYRLYLPWMRANNVYTVRFEDLVGSKGGGSDAAQEKTIYGLAQHIGITLSQEKFAHVKNKLFGNSGTFREGKIDGWKKNFTPAMKKAFKKVPGANQLLIELGYEKDENW
jgi:hypothetical protein